MAKLINIASTSAGCGGEAVNTGELGCDIEFGLVIHALGFKKGYSIDANEDITQEFIDKAVQSGNIIPIMDAFSSEPTIADDTMETSPLGVEALALRGLPKYMLTMKKGQYYYKQMSKLTGFGNLNYVLGDVNGNWKFAIDADGNYTGFTAGQTTAMITTPATATETEKKSLTFQLTDRNQIDESYAVVLASKLFPISEVSGINGATLSFADENGAVPPAAGTELKIKAVFAADNNTPIEGLATAGTELKVSINDVPSTVSLVDDGDGFYTLTVSTITAGNSVKVWFYDSTENKNVVILDGVLMRSNVLVEEAV